MDRGDGEGDEVMDLEVKSFMTGQPIFTSIFRIPDEVPMLAERFQQAGYRTGGFVANSLVSAEAEGG